MKKLGINYKLALLSIVSIFIIFYLIKNNFIQYIKSYYNPNYIKEWILSFKRIGFLVFIFLQIVQVVIFFIPGKVIQVAGGYIFGITFGIILSVIGIMLGSIITFQIARNSGENLLEKILPQREYTKIKLLIDKPKNTLMIFLLYLIPGFPKDILGYVSGITTVRIKKIIMFSTLARMPGIIISAYLGSNLYSKNYRLIMCSIIITLLLAIIASRHEIILNYFSKLFSSKVSNNK